MITKKEWVDALKSGKYKKGIGVLRRDDTYCCLGVFSDLLGGKWIKEDVHGVYRCHHTLYSNSVCWLPIDVSKQLKLIWHEMKLAEINDNTEDFSSVIEYIENHIPDWSVNNENGN